MAHSTPDFNAIRQGILRDIANLNPKANVAADGDFYIRANGDANAVEGLYAHQRWIARQILPDTADFDNLLRHASQRDLSLKAANASTGSYAVAGTPGFPIPLGTEAKSGGGIAFLTTAAAVVGAEGTVAVAAQASTPGAQGNLPGGTALTLTSAPDGIQSAATIVSMTGGTDVETPAELLSRLLFVLRNPPCGGALHDYYTWAMQIPGVAKAWPIAQRRNTRSVDVAIYAEGGAPSQALIDQVTAYIDGKRPPCGSLMVFAPQDVPVAVSGALVLSGTTKAVATGSIDAALAAYFASLSVGESAILNLIRRQVSSILGVRDFTLDTPLANVAALIDSGHVQRCTYGGSTWA